MQSEIFEADVKNGIAFKKKCIAMTKLINLLAPGWNYNRNYFLKSSIIKYAHIFYGVISHVQQNVIMC